MQIQTILAKSLKAGNILISADFNAETMQDRRFDFMMLVMSVVPGDDGLLQVDVVSEESGHYKGDQIIPTVPAFLLPEETVRILEVVPVPDREIMVRTVASKGEPVSWHLSTNLTGGYGDINFHNSGLHALSQLGETPDVYLALLNEQAGEISWVARKDGKFGVVFELECASKSSEATFSPEDGGEYLAQFLDHDAAIANLMSQLPRLEAQFPEIEFCIPPEAEVIEERPAIWAWCPLGALTGNDHINLTNALFAVEQYGVERESWKIDVGVSVVLAAASRPKMVIDGAEANKLMRAVRQKGGLQDPNLDLMKVMVGESKKLESGQHMLQVAFEMEYLSDKSPGYELIKCFGEQEHKQVLEVLFPNLGASSIKMVYSMVSRK